jgi:hypothetical protein
MTEKAKTMAKTKTKRPMPKFTEAPQELVDGATCGGLESL